MYRVTVSLTNGVSENFTAEDSYGVSGGGRICVWNDVSMNGSHFDFYSIPLDKINKISEVKIEESSWNK